MLTISVVEVLKTTLVSLQDPNAKGSLEQEQQLNLLSIEHEGESSLKVLSLRCRHSLSLQGVNTKNILIEFLEI